MADALLAKILHDRKSVTMEDCKRYIEEYKPDDRQWFYDLCMKPDKATKKLIPWLKIKQKFYQKYFPSPTALSRRMELFAGWNMEEKNTQQEEKK